MSTVNSISNTAIVSVEVFGVIPWQSQDNVAKGLPPGTEQIKVTDVPVSIGPGVACRTVGLTSGGTKNEHQCLRSLYNHISNLVLNFLDVSRFY